MRGPSRGKENFICTKRSVSGVSVAFWQRPTGRKFFPLPQLIPSLENFSASVKDPRDASFFIQGMIQDKELRQRCHAGMKDRRSGGTGGRSQRLLGGCSSGLNLETGRP